MVSRFIKLPFSNLTVNVRIYRVEVILCINGFRVGSKTFVKSSRKTEKSPETCDDDNLVNRELSCVEQRILTQTQQTEGARSKSTLSVCVVQQSVYSVIATASCFQKVGLPSFTCHKNILPERLTYFSPKNFMNVQISRSCFIKLQVKWKIIFVQ